MSHFLTSPCLQFIFKMNYLQSEKNYTILHSISRILKQNGLEGTESLSLLADKTVNKTGWTSVLLDAYDNRSLPVYTSELMTRINTAYHQEMTQVNSTRKKLMDHLEKEISLLHPAISNYSCQLLQTRTLLFDQWGYNPYKDQFEMVVNNNQPPEHQILRCAVHHPKQKLFNLPLSLLNVLKYSERVGCSNSMLKTLLIIFLTKHQPELVETIDPHSL